MKAGRIKAGSRLFTAGACVGAAVAWLAINAPRVFGSMEPHASAQSAPAPAKYSSKVVLENDRVRVKDVTFPPGVLDTGTHTHEYAHVGVILTKGSLVFTDPGKPGETVQFEAGSVGFREAKATHQVANPGKMPMRVIEVEIK
jgi:mannose-6-phosphate isomerase-like protein (cupin superfamily)